MVDIIIVLIVIVLLGLALKGSIKHFKGEGACCGGGSGSVVLDIPEKSLENPVLGKKVLKVSGMHCEHCVKAVTEAINKVDGASAKVDLSQNEAVASYDRELDEEELKRMVKECRLQSGQCEINLLNNASERTDMGENLCLSFICYYQVQIEK